MWEGSTSSEEDDDDEMVGSELDFGGLGPSTGEPGGDLDIFFIKANFQSLEESCSAKFEVWFLLLSKIFIVLLNGKALRCTTLLMILTPMFVLSWML